MSPERRTYDSNPVLGYLLTWTCYGTRLHGDARGTVDRHHNRYGEAPLPANPRRVAFEATRLAAPPFYLDAPRRHAVEGAIRRTCAMKGWLLSAVNVRTNHVHVVVRSPDLPDRVMASLKAWSTQAMSKRGLVQPGAKVWTRGGSRRLLWTPARLEAAVDYVLNRQGDDLD
jgi:REP element-mobilizing transposase RayT